MKELVTGFNCLLKVFSIYVCVCVGRCVPFKTGRALELNTWVVFREDAFPEAKAKNLGELFFLLSFIFQAWMIKSTVKPKGDGITNTRCVRQAPFQ
jgi:hypothetical protein